MTYGRYLKLEELLELQAPLSDGPEHDETLFIVIHQVYELWFKQVLHEVSALRRALDDDDLTMALTTMKRVLAIFKTLVVQIDILETISPISFLSFRDAVDRASGFQSAQFRELEYTLGYRNLKALETFAPGSRERARLEAALAQPTLYTLFLRYLARAGYAVPPDQQVSDLSKSNGTSPEVQEILVDIYRNNPSVTQMCERLVDLDEGLLEWRYRHVKMVERTLGTKAGTGGSSGAEYLRGTLSLTLFPDLWAIRTRL